MTVGRTRKHRANKIRLVLAIDSLADYFFHRRAHQMHRAYPGPTLLFKLG